MKVESMRTVVGLLIGMCFAGVSVMAGDLSTDDLTVYGKLDVSIEGGTAPTNGLKLYYSFNTDDGGTVYDQSGYGYDATVSGATWVSNSLANGGYEYDGSNDYLSLAHLDTTNETTICFWARMDEYGADSGDYSGFFWLDSAFYIRGIEHFSNGSSGSRYIKIWGYYSGGVIQLNKKIADLDGSESAYLNTWHHYVAVFKSGANRLYIDGVLEASNSNTNEVYFDGVNPLLVGKGIGSRYTNGEIDEFRVYDRALTTNDVYELYMQDRIAGEQEAEIEFQEGVRYCKDLGDIPMGAFTNSPYAD